MSIINKNENENEKFHHISNIQFDSAALENPSYSEEILKGISLNRAAYKSRVTKGLVERYFSVICSNPTEPSNFKKDCREKSMMTRPEFEKLIVNSVSNYNKKLKNK